MPRGWGRLPTIAAGLGLVVLGVGILAAAYIFSGLYNVSARKEHFDITTGLLDVIRRQSVRTHAVGLEAPALDDPDMIRLGAAHFAGGCALCHGAPETPRSPLASAMLPEPPRLDRAAIEWSAEELFWIVEQGQKYTGMPHWIAPEREDEIWSVVAFLKQLPGMEAGIYAELATGGASTGPAFDGVDEALADCMRCHGAANEVPPSALVPRLGGQTQSYLVRSLREYRSGTRQSGVMQLVAGGLTDTDIGEFAAYYAAGEAAPMASEEADPQRLERGALIVSAGVPESGIPGCINCHSERAGSPFPRLAGQSARYLEQQLRLWKEGLRDHSAFGAIMSVIARRLSDSQIADVAAYLQSLPPPAPDPAAEQPGRAP